MAITQPKIHDIQVGDPVVVLERSYGRAARIRATVTKAGRVWLTITEDEPESGKPSTYWRPREWRMRRDTQAVQSDYSYADCFRTPAQEAWHAEVDAAKLVLLRHGVSVDRLSPYWNTGGGLIKLAALLETAVTAESPAV